MPNFDRTGPRGLGPKTGRGMGPCGEGRAFSRGFGRGFGRGFRGSFNQEDNKDALKQEEKYLEEELKAVKEKMDQLEK